MVGERRFCFETLPTCIYATVMHVNWAEGECRALCLPPLQMLGLIVLFTVFLGLVGMLIISQEVQRRLAAAGSRAPSENLRSLEAWLAGVGCHLPSAGEVTAVLGRIASRGVQPVNEVRASGGRGRRGYGYASVGGSLLC